MKARVLDLEGLQRLRGLLHRRRRVGGAEQRGELRRIGRRADAPGQHLVAAVVQLQRVQQRQVGLGREAVGAAIGHQAAAHGVGCAAAEGESRLALQVADGRRGAQAELRLELAAHLHGQRVGRAMREGGVVAARAGHAARAGQRVVVVEALAELGQRTQGHRRVGGRRRAATAATGQHNQ